MRKSRVTVPAVCTNLGPGVGSLALALGLHLSVSFVERTDTHFLIETQGEDSADFSPDCYHPVAYGAVRVFQQLEDAPLGLRIDIRNSIPIDMGLGARVAMTAAGLVGANSLMGSPLQRDTLIELGTDILGQPDGLMAAMVGGLTASLNTAEKVIHRRIDIPPFKVLVVLPRVEHYDAEGFPPPASIAYADVLHNVTRSGLLIEALRGKDYDLLREVLSDRMLEPTLARHIPGYEAAVQVAQEAGAVGVTICGNGPALLIFALSNHYRIADAVQSVFDGEGILSQVWTLSVDTQGVVVTAAETLVE